MLRRTFLACVLLLALVVSTASAQVSFDTAAQTGASSVTTKTTSMTVAANSNRVLIGMMLMKSAAPTTITMTWNGTSMTQIGSPVVDGLSAYRIYVFGLIAPATGTQNLVGTITGVTATTMVVAGWSFYNADQTTGWNNQTSNTGNSTTGSVAITTSSGDAVAAGMVDNNGSLTPTTSGATSDFEQRAFDGNYRGAHQLSTGATETPTWTSINATNITWAAIGVNVIQASGGGGGTPSGHKTLTGAGR